MASSAGRTLGRYRLERLVGRGGMAEVWEARDQTLGRRVAVKIIAPDLAADARFHERFLSEARSVAALEHSNVLPIYDFGESDGEPYLVMPLLESGTLSDRLKQSEVPIEQAIDWIRQLASALDAAHAASVLHRDVKPANVMIGAGGRLLLADFGIAKSSQSGQLTATGLALGTPAYMAPELARGEPATPSSDRYALGVLAYELLCGRPPFAGDNPLALLHQHLTTPVPTIAGVRPDLPEDLDPAFARILAKEPDERPPTCAALAEEIARAFGGSAAATSPRRDPPRSTPFDAEAPTRAAIALPSPAASASRGEVASGASAPRPSGPRRTARVVEAALVSLALGAALLVWATRERSAGPDSSGDVAATAPSALEADPAAGASAPTGDEPGAGSSVEVSAGEGKAAAPSQGAVADGAERASQSADNSVPPVSTADAVAATAESAEADTPVAVPGGRPEGGRWAVPPAEALAIFDRVGDAWRKGRFQPGLFTELEPRVAALRRNAGATPGVELLASWVAGGKALAGGDVESARDTVRSFFAIQNPLEWSTLLPARFLMRHQDPPADWQVALFWADPRGEARALVEEELRRTPNDRNLLLARAVLEHLDGRHDEAARQAMALDSLARGPARAVLARFTGDQLLWSGDVTAAISWYKRLLVAPDRTENAAVLRTLAEEGGPPLIARACAGGFMPACDAGRPHPGPRARRARQQP